MGSSINYVTAFWGGGKVFCDYNTKAIVLKGGGGKNYPKLRDVLCGRPISSLFLIFLFRKFELLKKISLLEFQLFPFDNLIRRSIFKRRHSTIIQK